MKAKVIMELVKPTRRGRQIVSEKITADSDNLISKVNDFINQRLNDDNKIRVKNFTVECYSWDGRLLQTWYYKPTYRTIK